MDAIRKLLISDYAQWRTDPRVDHSDPTNQYVASLAQCVIALAAMSGRP